jgi:uncharacterized protein (DUF885 family)
MRLVSPLLFIPLLACSLARAADSPEERKAALEAALSDYWQDQLKHDPEMASALGDKRYDDQLSDYSVQGYNASLDRGRAFLDRLGAIDTAGLSDEEKRRKDQLVEKLIEEQAEAESKPWELPVNEDSGLYVELPFLVAELHFDTQQDYEHYVDRLKAVPDAFTQITTNLMTGLDDNNVLSRDAVDRVIAQANAIGNAKPEESVFARPLRNFPANISAADRDNDKQAILNAISRRVLPAYTRFGEFMLARYAPHAGTGPPSHTHGYMLEQNLVLELRTRAEAKLGAKFDLKAFREECMADAAASPEVLGKRLADWIAEQK